MRILIVGAEVAGLTVAGLLHRQGETPESSTGAFAFLRDRLLRFTSREQMVRPLVKQLTEPISPMYSRL